MLACVGVCCTCLGNDSRLIRRLYIDSIGIPPTIEEIEWYTVYNKNKGYAMAVDWVVSKSQQGMKDYYLSDVYIKKQPELIAKTALDNIIKYQVGKTYLTERQADYELILLGNKCYTDSLDIIDYFSMCMMSRVTHVDEANLLLRVFKSYANETEGYLEVISLMKEFKDFKYK